MKDVNRYSSIEELKDNSKPIDPTSARSMERHDRLEYSLSLLRQDYLRSKSSENNTSVEINSEYGL